MRVEGTSACIELAAKMSKLERGKVGVLDIMIGDLDAARA